MNFSVSISVYAKDDPSYFELALESIFNQSVKPAEVVLVVDGPIPDSIDNVISSMQSVHSNLKVIYLKENVGHGEARRVGLENCSYDMVAIMDSDDIAVSDRFEKQLKCFEEDKELSIVGGYIYEFEEDVSNIIGIRNVPLLDSDIKSYMKSRCPFNQQTVMFSKPQVMNAGGYLDWFCEEDYYLWLRMYLSGAKFLNIPENLVFVRMSRDSYARRGGLRYFSSEAKLQYYMYKNNIISFCRMCFNVCIRLVVQVLLPNSVRKWIFSKLFRRNKG